MFVFAEMSNATGTLLTGGGGGGTDGAAGVELELPPPHAASTSEKIVNDTEASARILVSPIRPVGRAGPGCSTTRVLKTEAGSSAAFKVTTLLV